MIQIHHGQIQNIPHLQVVQSEIEKKMLPAVFFIHGFTSAKEHNLHYAYYLAKLGFRVILPEAPLHGERSTNEAEQELESSFWDIVTSAIDELPYFVDELTRKQFIDPQRIGVVGTSMGGIVALGALTQYSWIKVAASLMGTPAYASFAKSQVNAFKKSAQSLSLSEAEEQNLYKKLETYDLSKQPERLKGRPLLFWHSEIDDVVPFEPTYNFFQKAQKFYKHDPQKIKFIRDKTSGHKVSRQGVLETVRWFEKHL